MTLPRRIILTTLVTTIGAAAFRLSFDAQVTLALAAGINVGLGWLYPAVVDAAILTGVLLRIWFPHAPKGLHVYLWSAIGFWTATSVLGNAFHIVALPEGTITVPLELAIAINTVPAITLFLVIHIVATIATPKPAPRALVAPASRSQPRPARAARTTGTPAGSLTDDQLRSLMARNLSARRIAELTGLGKSTIADRLRRLRSEHPDPQEV